MQDRKPRTDIRTAEPNSLVGYLRFDSARKQTFSPCTFGLILLAVAVALFNYGYRTSLYRLHKAHAAPYPVARAIVEHRPGDSQGSLQNLRPRTCTKLEFTAYGSFVQAQFSCPVFDSICTRVSTPPRALPFFDSALPLRSPPVLAA